MRMDQTAGQTAADIVNSYSEKDLTRILYDWAEEKWAARIAKFIVDERKQTPIETTGQLVELIDRAIPKKVREKDGSHPARKTFQALRIDVNSEFEVLYSFLEKLPAVLKSGGRVAVLTFHSGEDRLVKKAFRQYYREGIYSEICEDVVRPSAEECFRNPRAKSTKLRWAIRA